MISPYRYVHWKGRYVITVEADGPGRWRVASPLDARFEVALWHGPVKVLLACPDTHRCREVTLDMGERSVTADLLAGVLVEA